MAGYTRNIAVIKGVKGGFSSDGAKLTGLIKAERYGKHLRAEVTFINFSPLTEGRYAVCLSDGAGEEIFGEDGFDGESELDTSYGFAAAVCFVLKGEVSLIAAAVCGDYGYAVDYARRALERSENVERAAESAYDDEAIAGENYYEKDGECDAGGGDVRKAEQEKEENLCGGQNEDDGCVCEEPQKDGRRGEDEVIEIPLAHDLGFYGRMKGEIDGIFAKYPEEEGLESVIEDSRWVKITYGRGRYYVFGVISADGRPRYICYGVPSKNSKTPPDSLKGAAGYVPVEGGGYWVTYQDAATGASIKIDGV